MFAAWREELNWVERLLEQLANSVNLEAAMQRVIANKGAAGVDGMTVTQLKQGASTRLREMREELTPVTRGWVNYFKLVTIKTLCESLDEWIKR